MYHDSFKDQTINTFKNQIVQYVQENQINGEMLEKIKRKQFSENLIQYIGNNKKIRGAGNKTWDRLKKYAFHDIFSKLGIDMDKTTFNRLFNNASSERVKTYCFVIYNL